MSSDRPSTPNPTSTSSAAPSPTAEIAATAHVRTPIMLRLGVRPSSLGPGVGQGTTPSTPRTGGGFEQDRGGSQDDGRSGERLQSATPSVEGTRTPPVKLKVPAAAAASTTLSTLIPSAPTPLQHRGRLTRRATNMTESDPPPTSIHPIAIERRASKTFMQGGRMAASSKPTGITKRSHKTGGRMAVVARDRPRSTQSFVTCLDYPKQSNDEYGGALLGGSVMAGVPTAAIKAQRKSKVEAIGRLDTSSSSNNAFPETPSALASGSSKIGTSGLVPVPSSSTSTSPVPQSTPVPGRPSNNPIIKAQNLQLAPALDLNTVRTTAPRYPPPRTQPRMFGLEECPTFYPTEEEFADPMEYVKKIGAQGGAQNYGMCKIVPPEGWKMPFVLDSQVGFLWLEWRTIGSHHKHTDLSPQPQDIPFPHPPSTTQLPRSVITSQNQFSSTTSDVPLPAREPECNDTDHRSPAARRMGAEKGCDEDWIGGQGKWWI
jgi:hypothetical protein